ncbi:MAG TPA: DUF1223 domain-containing protein [Bryobacteraceae bacterium]|jgi:hypothetical protein
MRTLALAFTLSLPLFAGSRAPVLVELFTSEGCSSCPPADRLLADLDSSAIVLEVHVDYWDHQGWRDPFSSHDFTQRQESYGRMFNLDSVYTPEMVVDGVAEFNGTERARAQAEIARAAARKKAAISLARVPAGLHVAIEAAPADASVYLALADDRGESQVRGGENDGRHLQHRSILRSVRKIGSVKRGAGFTRDVELPGAAATQRVIVFLQESGPGRVSGAALLTP